MIDELHFFVDQKREISCIDVNVEQDGIRVILRIETADASMSEWSKDSMDDFGNEVNALMALVMSDFHRCRKSVSRNAQLEAVGLPADYREMFEATKQDEDTPLEDLEADKA